MNRITAGKLPVLIVLLWLSAFCFFRTHAQQTAPPIFSYSELETLYAQTDLPAALDAKLKFLLTTPFVDNSFQNTRPFSKSAQLGEFLRVAEWNVERGLEYDALEAVFSDSAKFEAMIDAEKFPEGSEKRAEILREAEKLRRADVIILNEVDLGIKRTDYRNIAADLAAKLKMNYAFGVQFVELSPVHFSQNPKAETDAEKQLSEAIKVDPARYKGLHGIAVLSRFPLENVRLVPFVNQPYDWYKGEKNGASLLEKGKRKLSEAIFLEQTLREVRRGGRTTLLAEIADAKFPGGRVTIAATHLENRTKSKNRVNQLKELLGTIKNINHPVVLAGDMNTSSADLTPTSLTREIVKRFGKPGYWIRKGIAYALGFGLIEDVVIDGVTFWRKQSDPTVKSVPILMPNSERKFFTTLKNFRFADGGAFDFRGDKTHSHNEKGGTLANSNERGSKGFVSTYQVKRPFKFIGKYKLDWFFVKPANLKKPSDKKSSYQFAPHFGITLTEVNKAIKNHISDHRPMIVDLPLNEPSLK